MIFSQSDDIQFEQYPIIFQIEIVIVLGKNFKEKIVKTWLHSIADQSVKNDELSVVYKRETISLVTKNPSRNEECYVIYVMETRSRNDQACTPSERLDHFVAFYCTSTYIHPDTHTRSPT